MTIIISSVFSEDGKFYPQLFLDDAVYQLVQKCYSTKKIDVSEEIDVNKTKESTECEQICRICL